MRRQVAVAVAVALLAAPLPTAAQQSRTLARYGDWSITAVESGYDVSSLRGPSATPCTSRSDCILGNYLVILDLHDGIFNDGLVTAGWDDGSSEQLTFFDGDRILSASTWTESERALCRRTQRVRREAQGALRAALGRQEVSRHGGHGPDIAERLQPRVQRLGVSVDAAVR